MWTVLVAVAVWSSLGVAISIAFRRQGHNFLLYAAIAIWLGPLVALIMASVRRHQEHAPVRILRANGHGSGWIDVLIGVDGSEASIVSVREVMLMLGSAVGRVRVVSALDRETANSPTFFENDDELERHLVTTAARIGYPDAELAFVSGRADRALVEHATEGEFDLLVVAHRSNRLRGFFFGSTVERLARSATVSLIIGPPAHRNGSDQVVVDLATPVVHHPSNKPYATRP